MKQIQIIKEQIDALKASKLTYQEHELVQKLSYYVDKYEKTSEVKQG